jgi:hypothetical protein
VVHAVALIWIAQKCVRTPYAELVFLHPVVSVGQVVPCCASGARNVGALFFVFRWD